MLTQERVLEALGKIYASPFATVSPIGLYQIGQVSLFGPIVIGQGTSWDAAVLNARVNFPALDMPVFYSEVIPRLVADIEHLVHLI